MLASALLDIPEPEWLNIPVFLAEIMAVFWLDHPEVSQDCADIGVNDSNLRFDWHSGTRFPAKRQIWLILVTITIGNRVFIAVSSFL